MLPCPSVAGGGQPWSSSGRRENADNKPGRDRALGISRKLRASFPYWPAESLPHLSPIWRTDSHCPNKASQGSSPAAQGLAYLGGSPPCPQARGWISRRLGTVNHGIFPPLQPQAEQAFPLSCTTLRAWSPSGLCYSEELLLPHPGPPTPPAQGIDRSQDRCALVLCGLLNSNSDGFL